MSQRTRIPYTKNGKNTHTHNRPSYRETGNDPIRRLLAAVVVRTYRDLFSPSPHFRQRAIEFFDEEGIAWAAAFGIPKQKVRQKLAEVMGGG